MRWFSTLKMVAVVVALASILAARTPAHADEFLYIGLNTGDIDKVTLSGQSTSFAHLNPSINGITSNSSGDIFVLNDSSTTPVMEFNPSGQIIRSVPFSSGYGITVDPSGNLFVGGNYTSQIWKITPNGSQTLFAGAPFPVNFASDSRGDLFYAYDSGIYENQSTVVELDPNGNRINAFNPPINNPTIAIDPASGNLFAGTYVGGLLEMNPTTGAVIHNFGAGIGPSFMAFDSSGNLFFTDVTGSNVKELNTQTGAVSTIISGISSVESLTVVESQGGGPSAVPEPASLTLLGVGGLCLLGYRWLRRRGA